MENMTRCMSIPYRRMMYSYNLAFTEVGMGMGNYVVDQTSAANGKVFEWVSPSSENKLQGNFEPVICTGSTT